MPNSKSKLTWPFVVCLAIVLIGLSALDKTTVAWARSNSDPRFQTIPTIPPTVVKVVTSTPTREPTAIPDTDPTATVVAGPGAIHTPTPTVQDSPDLQLHVYAHPHFAVPGMSFELRISVENAGTNVVEALIVHMTIPNTVDIVDATTSVGQTSHDSGELQVMVPQLSEGESLDVRVTMQVKPSTPLGTVIENLVIVETGTFTLSQIAQVSLPPAQLPVTGARGETFPVGGED